jgi:hypothetical protein
LLDNDKRVLARALMRGLRAGAFRIRSRSRILAASPEKTRRHLPLIFG